MEQQGNDITEVHHFCFTNKGKMWLVYVDITLIKIKQHSMGECWQVYNYLDVAYFVIVESEETYSTENSRIV